jgi:hypothetical protein
MSSSILKRFDALHLIYDDVKDAVFDQLSQKQSKALFSINPFWKRKDYTVQN